MDATFPRNVWFADGFRWMGSVLYGVAEHLERVSTDVASLDPRISREAEAYMDAVRTRVHTHF